MTDKDPTVKALFANTFGSVLAEEPERFRSPSKRKILYFLIYEQKLRSLYFISANLLTFLIL
ncbi:hypothetical protein HMPREF3291_11895 [Bacillus sp. HMSC76G11]|nr:hypothetical protein HMPREF3291_11895 [Bacillus sp. HMSC76G11]